MATKSELVDAVEAASGQLWRDGHHDKANALGPVVQALVLLTPTQLKKVVAASDWHDMRRT